MMYDQPSTIRHMGVAVAGPRLSYCVIEPPDLLIDWGVRHKLARDMKQIEPLVLDLWNYYQPQYLFLEDTTCQFCKLGAANTTLLNEISALARFHNVKVCYRNWPIIKATLCLDHSNTLDDVAAKVAERFPVIAHRIPPKRQPWLPEHRNMVLIKALALSAIQRK